MDALANLLVRTATVAALAMPAVAAAQPAPHRHQPDVQQEWNTDHFRFHYDDGICHLDYEYNFKDGHTHFDKHGDCSEVRVPGLGD